MQTTKSKKNWLITSSAFQRLLEWLDDGEDSGGQAYLEMRGRLVDYFDRKNCLSPNELADETLNRVARRIEEKGNIESETPAKYCYITAKFVFLENLRGMEKASVSIDDISAKEAARKFSAAPDDDENDLKEKILACLEKCVGELEAKNRELIVNYYYGTERVKIENRRALAEKLSISSNALNIRACRIRGKLEICVGKCAKRSECVFARIFAGR